jgi:cytochrome c-type biogenesis protein
MAITADTLLQGTILLVSFTAGLGLPFILIALVYDRAPGLLRPLVRHGQAVSVVGGILVIAVGVAMIMDWLAFLPQFFNFAPAL